MAIPPKTSNQQHTSTKSEVPAKFEQLHNPAQIQDRVAQLGAEIAPWVSTLQQRTKLDVVCIPVMRGGFFFAADLMRSIPHSLELCPVTTSSYSSASNDTPHLTVQVDIRGVEVQGRGVLIVDDICDSGRTLAVLCEKLQLVGAQEVQTVTLIQRKTDRILHAPKWVGFQYDGPEWFVGYGMEDAGRWRNLTSVYRIKGS
jgi:hypoxanthine phosphoribosyltransferase